MSVSDGIDIGIQIAERVVHSGAVVQILVLLIVVLLVVFAGVVVIHNIIHFMQYCTDRKTKTRNATYQYAESILSTIHNKSVENATGLMHGFAGGEMTQEDRLELLAYNLASSETLYNRIKNKIKEYIRDNGYYTLKKNADADCKSSHEMYEQKLHDRSEELRAIAQASVSGVFRPNSPLVGLADKRFSYDEGKKCYRKIVERHIQEVDKEVEDIIARGYELFSFLYKPFEYKHKD
jgi:hypothetical protein